MTQHATHVMHPNSLAAQSTLVNLGGWFNECYYAVARLGSVTDREVLRHLFPESDDCNLVRSWISRMCQPFTEKNPKGDWLEECGHRKDIKTGLKVRVTRCLSPEQRNARINARLEESKVRQGALL